MSARLGHRWVVVRASFWFVPGIMAIGAVALAAVALALDSVLAGAALPSWVYAGGADGARALLSTVAGSMVTVAGVGFSITIVALVLASTQFGPRLLTLFMRDVTSHELITSEADLAELERRHAAALAALGADHRDHAQRR